MKSGKMWPIITAVVLAAIFAIALALRAAPYSQVFTADGIKFTGNDAYYHMRLVESFVHNFPHFSQVDPYLSYPTPGPVVSTFFGWLLGVVVWILGLGSPSEHLLNTVGAWFPAVLGALMVIPVFFIGKVLFNRWVGFVSALLIAVMPGEFLGRSILGFTDQHVMESLLVAVAVLFLILAVKWARERQVSLKTLVERQWRPARRPLIYAGLAGLFLGLYILTWQGALLLVFVFGAYFVIQAVIDRLKARSLCAQTVVGTVVFLVAFLVSLPITSSAPYAMYHYRALLGMAILLPLVLRIVAQFMQGRLRLLYPLALAVLGAAVVGVLYLAVPSVMKMALNAFQVFTPSVELSATIEAQPLFRSLVAGGNFFETPAWFSFYFALPVGLLVLLLMIIRSTIWKGDADKNLFIVWTVVMLAASVAQRRFAYYFAVNVALLAGFASVLVYYLIAWGLARTAGDRRRLLPWSVLDGGGLETRPAAAPSAVVVTKKARRRERQEARRREMERIRKMREQREPFRIASDHVSVGLAVIIVFFGIFGKMVAFVDPNVAATEPPTFATASQIPYAPSDAWVKSLTWLKDNSPEPLSADNAYFKTYDRSFTFPTSTYGVASWWDYGYWITYIAHRIPDANPGQDPAAVKPIASLLVSQNETAAEELAKQMAVGYVVIDYQSVWSKFWAIVTWALGAEAPNQFFEYYYQIVDNVTGQAQQKLFFYPEYYQSLAVRLYNFDGKAVTPQVPTVISFHNVSNTQGQVFHVLDSEQAFSTYGEAKAFLDSHTTGNWRLVGGTPAGTGSDPLLSPVPLEALNHYELVYSSDNKIAISSSNQTAEIKVFKRVS